MSKLFRPVNAWSHHPALLAVQSTRQGGISPPPFDALNLGIHTEDRVRYVRENRKRFFHMLGIEEQCLAHSRQVHGDRVWQATQPGETEGYDAIMTNQKGLFLAITIADCAPIFIYDPKRKVCALAHAGWRGTVAEIGPKTVRAMGKSYGSRARDLVVHIGACIGPDSYEVSDDVASQFDGSHKRSGARRGKWMIDLKAANRDQLIAAGVPGEQIDISEACTIREQDTWFSHRGSGGRTGRMLAVLGMREVTL